MNIADDVIGLPALDIVGLVRKRAVSPEEIVRAHLLQIGALDARVGAFQLVCAERALADAAALAARDDLDDLPLAGVPVAVKDVLAVEGEPLRNGSLASSNQPDAADHEIVRRLRDAGAIVVGKTRVPELCAWGYTDSAFGISRSPWNLDRMAGGSSGGSGAAVAAAMVPIATGSDGGGSIRIPAAACGLFGIKPGIDVVPGSPGSSSWHGLSANGPLATTVDDAAALLAVMAARPDLADVGLPERRLRIALSVRAMLGNAVHPEWEAAARTTAALLQDAGHAVVEADPDYDRQMMFTMGVRAAAGIAEEAAQWTRRLIERRNRPMVAAGMVARRLGLVRDADRDAWRSKAAAFFDEVDVLLTPTFASPPPRAEGWSRRSALANYRMAGFAGFTGAWNVAGYPAAAVPAGLDREGVPLSVQLVARERSEALVLSVAKQLETIRPWARHAPLARVERVQDQDSGVSATG